MSGVVVDPLREVEPAPDADRLVLGVVLLAAARPTGG